MATTNAFCLASPPLARICLHGDLQRFGRRLSLYVNTAAEAIRALSLQLPGFRRQMNEGWYRVRIAGEDTAPDQISTRLHEPLSPGDVIHLVPRTEGAKSGGVFQAVLGVAL
ncbi:tail assembly protein, partial [Escherichia coli]|nr:tail assembly protein [Escherichia coli]